MNTPWYDYLPDSFGRMFYFVGSGDGDVNRVLIFSYLANPDIYTVTMGLDDLGTYFDIYGFDGNSEEIFQPGKNYRSFTISLKSN